MTMTIETSYENGVLKSSVPLLLAEHEKVQVTIHSPTAIHSKASRAEQTAGLLRWTGDPQILRRLAKDDEFGILELP